MAGVGRRVFQPKIFTENQHSCVLLEKLLSQREAGSFCDVVLHVQGQRFFAHRNVLASCSPYFNSVLKTIKIVKEQLVQLNITCRNIDAFQLLLNYFYTGAIVIDIYTVEEILSLANEFLVDKIKNYCAEYLNRYLDISNCFAIRDMAEKYDLPNLFKSACSFISKSTPDTSKRTNLQNSKNLNIESAFEENAPVTVAPLEKENKENQSKLFNASVELVKAPNSSKCNLDVAPDFGASYDDDIQTSEAEYVDSTPLNGHNPWVKNSDSTVQTVPPLKIKRSSGSVSVKSTVRSHICHKCKRAFKEKSHLVRHEQIHSNAKQFKCEYSGYDYSGSRKDKFKEHIGKHHGENATAVVPYRSRKQHRLGSGVSDVSQKPVELESHKLHPVILLVDDYIAADTAVDTNNPAPVVYTYETGNIVGSGVSDVSQKPVELESDNLHPLIELVDDYTAAATTVDTNNPAPIVYTYETTHQDTGVTPQQVDAVAHNF